MASLDLVKQYIRVDGNDVDDMLSAFIETAIADFGVRSGVEYDESDPRHKFWVIRKVATYYHFREDITEGSAKVVEIGEDLMTSIRTANTFVNFSGSV